jgi:hypothetical protein
MCYLLPSLFSGNCIRRLIEIFKREQERPSDRAQLIYSLFVFQPDEFWRHHYRFSSNRSPSGAAIGTARINELLVNGILPILLLYGRIFRDPVVRTSARDLLTSIPVSENSITRTLQQQLLRGKMKLQSAFLQQGAIQLHKFYCSPIRCRECAVGRETSLGSGA